MFILVYHSLNKFVSIFITYLVTLVYPCYKSDKAYCIVIKTPVKQVN